MGVVYPVAAIAVRMLGCKPKSEKVAAEVSSCVFVVSVIESGLRPTPEYPARSFYNPVILAQRDRASAFTVFQRRGLAVKTL